MPRVRLTQQKVKATEPTDRPQFIADAGQPGLYLRVGKRRADGSCVRSWVFQRDERRTGKTRRTTIGRWPAWDLASARERARELTRKMDLGESIRPKPPKEQPTLEQAVRLHQESMRHRGCAEGSIRMLEVELRRHVKPWLGRPLDELAPGEVRARHMQLSRASGPYLANRIMKHLRACYRTARKSHRDLPADLPTDAVEWNREERRDNPVPWDELPDFARALDRYENPIRRDYMLFLLHTALRKSDAARVRWEEVDWEAGTLFRPEPKGGRKKAFTLPLSRTALEILERRRQDRLSEEWAFPAVRRGNGAANACGPLREYRESEIEVPSPHRLRRTWATAAAELNVNFVTIQLILNHARPKDNVTFGYVSPSLESMRAECNRVSQFLSERMKGEGDRDEDEGAEGDDG
ncbi:MAG: integrase family protein [bacterium]|nr:integrase family protein [bacterium]